MTNTNGTIRVDAVDNLANTAPTLNLQGNSAITGTTIDDGTIINHGILEATSGINIIKNVATGSNPSDAGEQFINDGTIAVKFTATLTLDTDVLDNAGGTINVHSNATLNLNAVTIRGGTFTGAGDIYVLGTETTLDGSGSHPITIDDGTAITLRTGSTLTLDGTGGGSINGLGMIAIDTGPATIVADGTISVLVDATGLVDDTLLTLQGTAALTLNNLAGDLNASTFTGELTITTANVVGSAVVVVNGSGFTPASAPSTASM